ACIPQPGTTQQLEAITDRLMYRLAYRNFGTHESLVVNHTVDAQGTGQAGIRWYELRNPNTTLTVHQQGTYAPDTSHRWMGSMSMDGDGNMALGYSVSNGTDVFPAIRYTGRLATDPLNLMAQGEATLYPGYGSQTANARWGDYSMMGIDPVDDCTFWYTQEYYGATGQYWQTRVGKFRFASCGGGAIPTETPMPAPDPCTLPGVKLVTDSTGDAADITGAVDTEGTEKYDIQWISIAEPYTATGPSHLAFTMKVASLAGPDNSPSASPNSAWRMYFTSPMSTTVRFVDMRTDNSGVVTYKYGSMTGAAGTTHTTEGDADAGVYGFDGTIRITVATSKLGNLAPGQTLSAVHGRVFIMTPTGGFYSPDTANYPEPDKSVTYTLVGNASCQPVVEATPTTTGTAMPSSTSAATATRTSTSVPGTTSTPVASSTPNATATACPIEFADVPATGEGSTFYPYVRCLACRGIVSGYPCGGPGEGCNGNDDPYYRPSANVTRGQLSKIVANSAGLDDPIAEGQQQFADVEPGDPFYEFVERLAQTGAIAGYPCSGQGEGCDEQNRPYFRPGNFATRGQISKIVAIAAGFEEEIPEDRKTFTDVPADSPFWVYIERLAGRDVISGYGEAEKCPTGTPCFLYNDYTTRGQMEKIAANAFFPNCVTPARK
ncbi:MAG TPA: S-layer homology domain-containing protein, partial [Chloroflexia bacterium]|nr:S-layer homology domain-containing protein [Chloroflexia bacterium]